MPRTVRSVAVTATVVFAGCTGGSSDPSDTQDVTDSSGPTTTRSPRPELRWSAELVGPSQEDEVDGIAAAADGSVWITGKFERTVSLAGVELTSVGRADIPLARLSKDGEAVWVTRFGGTGEDNFFDIAAGPGGAVATGWFEGEIELDDVVLRSAGETDCVVASFADDGSVRWARSFGGPGPDGCNEVVVTGDGTTITSMDTVGSGEAAPASPDVGPSRDTVLMSLDRDGNRMWSRAVGGPGGQRGKAIAVGSDGTVAFGGDTSGPLVVDGVTTDVPGRRADAFVSLWDADGALRWVRTWGGPGADLVKGVAVVDDGVIAVGPISGTVDIGGHSIDAGAEADLVVAHLSAQGDVDWLGSVRADGPLTGAEITTGTNGGILFGIRPVAGLELVGADGAVVGASDAAQLVQWNADGSVDWTWPVPGPPGSLDEIDRSGTRVYVDRVVRNPGSGKDGLVIAIDLPGD
ncbi:MAG: hypothetical protein ACK4V6_08345 [Microthrixaceae bacterium]